MSTSFDNEHDAQIKEGAKTGEADGDSLLQIEAAIDELSALMNISTQNRASNNFQMLPGNRRDLACNLSRPLQRKLLNLTKCRLAYSAEAKERLIKCIRSLAERTLTDLLLLHQNPAFLTRNLWMAVRNRGCQFLGPAMQEEVLRLILLALEDGSALSRKVLVLFVVQKLLPRYPRASKTSVGHVVQLLYRASCFKLQKREDDSSLMQLKEEFRNYEALRREHDAQIIQIAMDACIRISPESWSSLLYGDTEHRSQMQSIMDRLQMTQSQSFSGMLRELQNALQRTADPYNLGRLLADFEFIDKATKENGPAEVHPAQILALLRRVQNLLVVYATVSPLFALNRQNRHYSLAMSQSNEVGSSNSLTSLLLNEPSQRSFNQLGNLCRNWSSMSSILPSQPEIQNQKLYSANLHASSQWVDQARMNQDSFFSQNNATLHQISTHLPSQKPVSRPLTDADVAYTTQPPSVNPYILKSSAGQLTTSLDKNQSAYQVGRGVTWRERPDSPSSRLTKLPPRSPTARRCQELAAGYRHSGLPPRRQWTSVNSVLHATPSGCATVDDRHSPPKSVNAPMREEELIRLIRISKTIQSLERQKHDLLERLGKCDVIGRNASSLTNLAGELNIMEADPVVFQSSNDAIGFVSSNDTVVPFSQTPVHNKYGPICRSNRRLAQSLMAFPPLEESVSHEEHIEGLLSEQTERLLAFEEDEDQYDLLNPDSFFSMKHATSMPAIPDDNFGDGLKMSLGEEEENPFKWIDILDDNEEELKGTHRDKPRAQSSIDLSAGSDVKNLTFA